MEETDGICEETFDLMFISENGEEVDSIIVLPNQNVEDLFVVKCITDEVRLVFNFRAQA